ncbi:pitrilysin family protein [Paracoccaceae bacterium Fryx2]|nr:pitrilysin family protein [Paracoccaceae bacterium Fryx2]
MMLRLAFALICLALPLRAEVPIQSVTSPGGITAWLVEAHEIPFAALEIRFRGGTSLDAPGKRGAVNLMTALLEEGADDLDAQGFAEARDDLAADFRFRASTDALSVSTRMLTENRDKAVELLRSALLTPRFDPDALERVRGQVLSGIRSDAKDPQALAGQVFDAAAFGAHPYGSSGDGSLESVAALTRDDILAAYKGALVRDQLYVAAVGDITAEDLGLLLDRLLGDLPASGAALPGRAEWQLGGGVTVQDFPTPQSVVVFGHQGIERDDPDFFAAFILNEILGGGRFSARLMTEVREKRGLTYGVSTYLAPMDHAETMMGQFSADNAKAAEAIGIVQAEWAKLATEGVTEAELAATKTYLTGSYPLRFDGNGPIANILVGMQMQGLSIDYATTRNAQIEAVTLDDVARVAKRLLLPESLHFVVVGQPTGLEPGN